MKKMMNRLHATMLFLFGMMILMSCDNSDNHDSPQEYAGVPLVILDTDIGSSTDDLFAMEMLYRYEEQGKCRLLGVVVDREGEQNAAFADVMNTYFGHGDVPIGLVRKGIEKPVIWIDYAHVADKQGSDGKPMFRRTVTDYSTLPDGWQLYRRLLAAQPDHSVSIVSTGFVTCLAQLLQSEGDDYSPLSGVELVTTSHKEPLSLMSSSASGPKMSIYCSRRWRRDRPWTIRLSRSLAMCHGLTFTPSSKCI